MNPLPKKPADSARAMNAGLTLAVTVGLFAWCGIWLDERWGSTPWMVVALTLLGVFGGGLHLVRELAPEALGSWGKTRRTDAAPTRKGDTGNEREQHNPPADD